METRLKDTNNLSDVHSKTVIQSEKLTSTLNILNVVLNFKKKPIYLLSDAFKAIIHVSTFGRYSVTLAMKGGKLCT